MTLWVTRQSEHPGAPLVVKATSGSVEVAVTEEIGHLRYFWHELGQALDAAERSLHMADHEDRLRQLELERSLHMADHEDRLRQLELEQAARHRDEARKPQAMMLAEESNGAD